MCKKRTEYELLVKDVYECLNETDGLIDVSIKHDGKLIGAAIIGTNGRTITLKGVYKKY